MRNLIASLLRYRPLMIVVLVAWIVAGFILFLRLDIEAYPDPSPPLVEFITQNPSGSAEEMEQQVTVPVETALFGMPHLEGVRSITIFGLNELKATQDWLVVREIKQVPGIIDVASFGGTTREYIAEIDPGKLLQYGV